MPTSNLNLKIDTEERMLFTHSPVGAVVGTLFGLGFAALCWFLIDDAPLVRLLFLGFSLFFVAAGIAGVFWRFEYDIDLVRREVRRVRGFWPSPVSGSRSLDEADGVWLTLSYRRAGNRNHRRRVPWWSVELRFPEEDQGTALVSSPRELAARQTWEAYARRLGLDAVDATGNEFRRIPYDELDDSLAARSANESSRPRRNPNPPMDSRIEFGWARGVKEIILPAPGINSGLVVLVLVGGAFAVLGGGFLLSELGILDFEVTGSETSRMLIPPIFLLVGLGIIWMGVRGSFTSRVLHVEGGDLVSEELVFGRRSKEKRLPLKEIESVTHGGEVHSRQQKGPGVRGGSATHPRYRARQQVVIVRTDTEILRLGQGLSQEEREWLAEALNYAAIEGELP